MLSATVIDDLVRKCKQEGLSASMIATLLEEKAKYVARCDGMDIDQRAVTSDQATLTKKEEIHLFNVIHAHARSTYYDANAMYPKFVESANVNRIWSRDEFISLPVKTPSLSQAYSPIAARLKQALLESGVSLMTDSIEKVRMICRRAINRNIRFIKQTRSRATRALNVLAAVAYVHGLAFTGRAWYQTGEGALTPLERYLVKEAKGSYPKYIQLCAEFNATSPIPVLYLRPARPEFGFTDKI